MKKKVTLTFIIEDSYDEHSVECAYKGTYLNLTIYNALQSIRGRLKYCSDEVSETEQTFLEELRSDLASSYIEEQT